MSAVAVKVRRVDPGEPGQGGGTGAGGGPGPEAGAGLSELERDLARARKLAWLLDANFAIGRFRFGFDAIVGLAPVVGDAAMALVGLFPVYLAWKHKLGYGVIATMVGVLIFDWIIGSVPAVGDLLDVAFKAHLINVKILERAAARARR